MDAVLLLAGSQIMHSTDVAMGPGSYASGETCGWGVTVHVGPLGATRFSHGLVPLMDFHGGLVPSPLHLLGPAAPLRAHSWLSVQGPLAGTV